MELILLENILNLGNIGDKVKVKSGYGRNFLLKQGKALRFNKDNQDFVGKCNITSMIFKVNDYEKSDKNSNPLDLYQIFD